MLTLDKPKDSACFLRLTGTLDTALLPSYGQLPVGFVPGTYSVRFLLGLAPEYVQPPGSTGPLDLQYQIPALTYANDPAASLQDTAWAQSTDVTIRALDANLTNADMAALEWGIDPIYYIPWVQLNLTVGAVAPEIDLQIEVKLTVYFHNSSASTAEVTVTIQGGAATLVVEVPANTSRVALLSQPFTYDSTAGGSAGLIVAQETTAQPTNAIVAFGSFTRA